MVVTVSRMLSGDAGDTRSPSTTGPKGGQFAPGGGRVAGKGKPHPKRPTRKAGPPKPSGPLGYDGKTGAGYGIKGGDARVRTLQSVLNRLGLTDSDGLELVVDGKFGPRTTSAVKKLQKRLGVEVTGKVTEDFIKQISDLRALPPRPAAKRRPARKRVRRSMALHELDNGICRTCMPHEHVLDNGICMDCDPDALDEPSRALLAALDELDGIERARGFDPAKHPRNPKGSPGGGRFRSMVDRLKDAIDEHVKGGGKGHPFDDFDREQLRRVAKARGIPLKRGEDRDSIAKKLLDHLQPAPKAKGVAKVPEPKPKPKSAPNAADSNKFHRSLSEHGLEDLAETVEKSVVRKQTKLSGGVMGDTRLVTHLNGKQTVRKEAKLTLGENTPRLQADAEQLSSLVARKLGLNAPKVYRSDKERDSIIHMEYVDGAQKPRGFGDPLIRSDEGRVMALVDTLILNGDRHSGNWFIKDGRIVPIDNGLAFDWDYFQGLKGGWELPRGHFTKADIEDARTRLQELEPDFEKLGRKQWFQGMMARLDQQEARAKDSGPAKLPPPVE